MKTRLFPLFVTLVLFIAACSRQISQMSDAAMAPTITPDEFVSVDLGAYRHAAPERWDVVMFRPPTAAHPKPGEIRAMRVVGLPGEMVEVRDGGVVVDGLLLRPPAHLSGVRYAAATDSRPPPRMAYPYQVPADCYFVLGDNAAHAFDSRFWGALPRENILGRVMDK